MAGTTTYGRGIPQVERPIGPVRDLTTPECREVRKMFGRQNPGYVCPTLAPVDVLLVKLLGQRKIMHHSAEMYFVHVDVAANKAHHYMITKKCEWKRTGIAAPSPAELAAWQAYYG